jgi:hypothetical protein
MASGLLKGAGVVEKLKGGIFSFMGRTLDFIVGNDEKIKPATATVGPQPIDAQGPPPSASMPHHAAAPITQPLVQQQQQPATAAVPTRLMPERAASAPGPQQLAPQRMADVDLASPSRGPDSAQAESASAPQSASATPSAGGGSVVKVRPNAMCAPLSTARDTHVHVSAQSAVSTLSSWFGKTPVKEAR